MGQQEQGARFDAALVERVASAIRRALTVRCDSPSTEAADAGSTKIPSRAASSR